MFLRALKILVLGLGINILLHSYSYAFIYLDRNPSLLNDSSNLFWVFSVATVIPLILIISFTYSMKIDADVAFNCISETDLENKIFESY